MKKKQVSDQCMLFFTILNNKSGIKTKYIGAKAHQISGFKIALLIGVELFRLLTPFYTELNNNINEKNKYYIRNIFTISVF